MRTQIALSIAAFGFGIASSASTAFALKSKADRITDCTLTIYEYVSNEGDGYSLGQTRILARHQLTSASHVASGSHPPISYVARLQPDGTIKATLSVKLDQYSDRSERVAVGEVQAEVEDTYSNAKDRYVLECKVRR